MVKKLLTSIRIVVISRNWYPSVKGGAEKFITRVSEKLWFHKDYEVIGITRYVSGFFPPRAGHKLLYYYEKHPIPIFSSLKFSLWASRITNLLKPDIVIVNSYWGEGSPIFIDKKIPVISIIHDVGLFRSEWARRHKLKHLLRVYVLKKVVKKARYIVVPTHVVKEDIVRFLKADPSKILVLGFEGVDGPFRRVHVNNGFFDIVQVGRFAPNKDHITTLKAFKEIVKEIPNARLWLVGGRPLDPEHELYFAKVKELVEEINRSLGFEAVKIVVDAPSVDPYYRIADICVAPSIGEEGFGLTVVECMAYGKPVVASDIFVKTGVASPERCIVFKRGDYEALVDAVIRLYKDPYLYEKIANRGLEFSKKHSWDAVAKKIDNIIRKIIQS